MKKLTNINKYNNQTNTSIKQKYSIELYASFVNKGQRTIASWITNGLLERRGFTAKKLNTSHGEQWFIYTNNVEDIAHLDSKSCTPPSNNCTPIEEYSEICTPIIAHLDSKSCTPPKEKQSSDSARLKRIVQQIYLLNERNKDNQRIEQIETFMKLTLSLQLKDCLFGYLIVFNGRKYKFSKGWPKKSDEYYGLNNLAMSQMIAQQLSIRIGRLFTEDTKEYSNELLYLIGYNRRDDYDVYISIQNKLSYCNDCRMHKKSLSNSYGIPTHLQLMFYKLYNPKEYEQKIHRSGIFTSESQHYSNIKKHDNEWIDMILTFIRSN